MLDDLAVSLLRREPICISLTLNIYSCIALITYIVRLKDGLVWIMNDPFDNRFYDLNQNSPAIWQSERQSFLRNVLPVPVHSHNNYWRRIPLFEALGSGCISVEADVHLSDSELLVGHTSRHLNDKLTLRTMYLDPLKRMIDAQNKNRTTDSWQGLFNQKPQQTFVLLVDHKTSGPETFAELNRQLQPLRDRDYLTYWNGTDRVMRPLTVVGTGNTPFESIIALNATHRDIFWDANLVALTSKYDDFSKDPFVYGYNQSNSYYASANFYNAVPYGWPEMNYSLPNISLVAPAATEIFGSQLSKAKARGLLTRYWGTPSQPPNLQEVVWRVLMMEWQVDILNMDDMAVVRARAHGWGDIKG